MHSGAFTATAPLILASASPRRRELLDSTGAAFAVAVSAVEEPEPGPRESPQDYALRMARMKARDVAGAHPRAYVLGADTVVAVEGRILGKPADVAGARLMLGQLCGREHAVVTGCCLLGPGGAPAWEYAPVSKVAFADVTPEAIAAYAATGESLDKAGGYAIQGLGAFMIARVEGSYTNVVGLPLAEVVEVLSRFGVIVPAKS